MNSLAEIKKTLAAGGITGLPEVKSFRDFLVTQAKVPTSDFRRAGEYDPFTFHGREILLEAVRVLDLILGSETGEPLKDANFALCGGAQFGKTILELYLAAYITSQRFLNVGVYLPDDGLADGIVDMKFRPVVLDNIGWLSQMTQIGKAVNKSGKSVNTKGAFIVTDGKRKASGMFRGLKKVPTSFSNDVVIRDEEDDIPRDKAKFLSGRMTASQLRLQIIVGTQRVHGAGQNKQFEAGSQGVKLIGPVGSKIPAKLITAGDMQQGCVVVAAVPPGWLNPEESWPQICRLQLGTKPSPTDPKLTYEGDFRRDGATDVMGVYSPEAKFYYAHPITGEELDANRTAVHYRRPERIKLRRWSLRVAQIGTPAIDLAQIVAHWTRAVQDDEEMIAFCCDRKAMPKSASQALSPKIIQRARDISPFNYGDVNREKVRVGGLDTGGRCWLVIREIHSPAEKRIVRADKIALGDMVNRMQVIWQTYGLSALFIDENPAVDEARTLALIFNGLHELSHFPSIDWRSKDSRFSLPNGLTWDGERQQWRGLKCAVVRFSKKQLGMGIEQGAVEFTEGGMTKFVPMIACNRFETIDRVVKEFLTPAENVMEVVEVGGKRIVRQDPIIRLPVKTAGSSDQELLEEHLLTGSQRAKEDRTGELGDYVDKCENHYLLGGAYSGLADVVAVAGNRVEKFSWQRIELSNRPERISRRMKGVLI